MKKATATAPPVEAVDSRLLLKTLTAIKKGDFSTRLPADHTGVAGKVYDAFNEVIELNERMMIELERISRAVGKEGKINQRANLGNVGGAWSSMIDDVNGLITDLMQPSTEIARVIGAVAKGDLTQQMPLEVDGRPLKGEFMRTAKVVNTMVDQLNSFASEVTRVAREVGTEGKLGGQAQVKGVAGTWKDLTDSVNSMASNLTAQVRNIAEVTTAVANGDLSRKITVDVRGEILDLKIDHQHDGRPAQLLRFGSNARGARSRHGRQTRRSGNREGCRRCLEGSDRFGQLHGRQPYLAGAKHCAGNHGGCARRSIHEDHG